MFDELARAIDALSLSGDPDELCAVLALRDRLDAKLAAAAGECRVNEWYRPAGYGSLTALLRARAGMTRADASRLSVLGKKLRSMQYVARGWLEGTLCEGQVHAIAAVVPARHAERFAEHEAAVVETIAGLTTGETVLVLRDWKARADALEDPPVLPDTPAPGSAVFLSALLDGWHDLAGSLDPEDAQLLAAALREAERPDPTQTPAERRAGALVDLAAFYLNYHAKLCDREIANRERPHLNVTRDLSGLGWVSGTGIYLPHDTLERLSCDAMLHRYLYDTESALLDYGRAQRSAPVELYQALLVRDGGCRGAIFDPRTREAYGCDRDGENSEVHHLLHWEHGGETCPANCALFCRQCHRYLHRHNVETVLEPDGTIRFRLPDGTTWVTKPRSQLPKPPIELPVWQPPNIAKPTYDNTRVA